MNDMPSMNQECRTCGHSFGVHWEMHAGDVEGCLGNRFEPLVPVRRDDRECECEAWEDAGREVPFAEYRAEAVALGEVTE